METEELATNCGERQIDQPKQKQAWGRSEADEEKDREEDPKSALPLDGTIAGAEPTEGWKQMITFDADVGSGDLSLKIFHG